MTNILTIDGYSIYDYFISGAFRLIHSEKKLNSINVFPVADGDTGTNLSLTMKMVILKSKRSKSIYETLSSISVVAIENAYGNSGMIFAQFLNGFSIEVNKKEVITSKEFAEIADKAAEHAYNSVGSPKEGTILSVMRDWSKELLNNVGRDEFKIVFENSVDKARLSVAETKYKMKVFMDNNVVDAGAAGFLVFIEGIHDYIKNGKMEKYKIADGIELNNHNNYLSNIEVTENRYCSQFYIESNDSLNSLKNKLSDFGDSVVVSGKGNHFNLHVHTDNPDELMEYLVQNNNVLSQKIEDMKLESDIIHRRKNKIGIVTDSIADISEEILDDQQITVIPISIICDSTQYLDKLTMTLDMFYKRLNEFKMNPTSAKPSSVDFERTFKTLMNHFDSIIGIFVSKKMSGTFETALKVSEKLSESGYRISVIDSKLNSAAQGLLVKEAARLVNKELMHEEIVDELNKIKEKIKIFVSVNDLTPMIKGGRVSKVTGFILSKLKLKPVVSIDKNGNGIVFKKTLSRNQSIRKILEQVRKDKKEEGIISYSIVYSDSIEDIKIFKSKLYDIIGFEPDYISQISAVVGVNAGKGAFAVSYVKGGN